MIHPIRAWWNEHGNRIMGRTPLSESPLGPGGIRPSITATVKADLPPPSGLW
jgi:hypothetical protein